VTAAPVEFPGRFDRLQTFAGANPILGRYGILAADSLVQFRCIALYPSPNGRVVHRQISLTHQLFQIAITQRKPQVPAYAQHNDLVLKMPPLNNAGRLFFTVFYPTRSPVQDCNTSLARGCGSTAGTADIA